MKFVNKIKNIHVLLFKKMVKWISSGSVLAFSVDKR